MYHDKDVVASFVEWLLDSFDSKFQCIAYSHNGNLLMLLKFLKNTLNIPGGRFDEHFIYRQLCDMGMNPELSMSEHKIFEMSVQRKKRAKIFFR